MAAGVSWLPASTGSSFGGRAGLPTGHLRRRGSRRGGRSRKWRFATAARRRAATPALPSARASVLGKPVSCKGILPPGMRSHGWESSCSRRRVPAVLRGDSVGDRAAAVLEQVVPTSRTSARSPLPAAPGSRWACWTSGCPGDPAAPTHLAARAQLPAGHWTSERVGTGPGAGRQGGAFRSLRTLTVRAGGHHLRARSGRRHARLGPPDRRRGSPS
jgi:hypothetical protein